MKDEKKPALLVLAAGMGSRYGGLKQVDPVGPGGETLMDYAVYDALRAGFGRVVFVIRRDFEADFRRRVAATFGRHVKVAYVFQEIDDLPGGRRPPATRTKPWGTAHAVRAARHEIGEPFAAINADDFYGRDAFVALARFLAEAPARREPAAREHLAMVGYRLRQTLSPHGSVARGPCEVSADGYLLSLKEHPRITATPDGIVSTLPDGTTVTLPGDTIVSMNMWGLTPAFFALIEPLFESWLDRHIADPKAEWYLSDVVGALVQSGRADVRVLPTDSRWFGVTYRQDRERTIEEIGKLIAAGEYPARLWPDGR
jgi:hypothetical protein